MGALRDEALREAVKFMLREQVQVIGDKYVNYISLVDKTGENEILHETVVKEKNRLCRRLDEAKAHLARLETDEA